MNTEYKNRKTSNLFLTLCMTLSIALSFFFPFLMDLILHADYMIWCIAKPVLILLFFITGFIAKEVDSERSGEWFKRHRIAQTAALCFAALSFGIIVVSAARMAFIWTA